MSEQAIRFNSRREQNLRRLADQRVSELTQQPERDIRERREAFDKMCGMITHVKEYASNNPGKRGLLVGSNYYIAHNGEYFTVYRSGVDKVFEKSFMRVVTLFDPLKFVSGHID